MKGSDVEMAGLPCEENSRQNYQRKFMEGRFGNVYPVWAHRQKKQKTSLIILENTEDLWFQSLAFFLITLDLIPRCSMYGIFAYIYHQNYPNVGKLNRP